MKTRTRIIAGVVAGIICIISLVGLTACKNDADVASSNISKEADSFHILRRIVFYNGITGDYILEIEGFCSIGNEDKPGEVSVTCKTATKGVDGATEDQYKKHFLGLSDNVTYFAEQIQAVNVSSSHYEVIFKPSTIIPDPVIR